MNKKILSISYLEKNTNDATDRNDCWKNLLNRSKHTRTRTYGLVLCTCDRSEVFELRYYLTEKIRLKRSLHPAAASAAWAQSERRLAILRAARCFPCGATVSSRGRAVPRPPPRARATHAARARPRCVAWWPVHTSSKSWTLLITKHNGHSRCTSIRRFTRGV